MVRLARNRLRLLVVCSFVILLSCDNTESPVKQNSQFTKPTAIKTAAAIPAAPALTRDQVVEARRKFKVKILSFDATQEFGTEFPYSDYIRLRITNGSGLVLPTLTVLTKRFDNRGRMIGSSRAPSISVADLKPGQSADVDYYPRGHLPGVKRIKVEIETLISPENQQFFPELPL
jgi:hypothetical protein